MNDNIKIFLDKIEKCNASQELYNIISGYADEISRNIVNEVDDKVLRKLIERLSVCYELMDIINVALSKEEGQASSESSDGIPGFTI